MLSKKEFLGSMQAIFDYDTQCDKLNDALSDVSWFYSSISLGDNLKTAIINLLENSMNDNGDTISWWLYEAPKDEKKIWITDDITKEEKEYDLTTVEDLYDYLANSFAKTS